MIGIIGTGMTGKGIASMEDIDKAMKLDANHPIGPFKLSDLVSNDVTLRILISLYGENSPIISKLIIDTGKAGKLGRKSTNGLYLYD